MQPDKRLSRDERIRTELFGEFQDRVFETRKGGFVPVAIEYRKLLRYLTPPQVRVLFYLLLRASKSGICFPTIEEIAHDIGIATKKHLRPLIVELERKGFVRVATAAGRTYYLLLDPAVAIETLRRDAAIADDELADINRLRADLNREPIQ